MPRRDFESDVSYERYNDRRDTVYSRRGAPVRERDRETIVREDVREQRLPSYLREDYGRTSAGPVVLRKKVVEDFEVGRPRSLSPDRSRVGERETVVYRRDESESGLTSRTSPRGGRARSSERDEVIIRREEREVDRRASAVPHRSRGERDREEIVIRRDERESRAPVILPQEVERERDEIIIRRDSSRTRVPPERYRQNERQVAEEIVVRRDEREVDSRSRRVGGDIVVARAVSVDRERERSRSRVRRSSEDDAIVIRRDERESRNGRGKERKEEIIIRRRSRSSSSSSSSSVVSAVPSVRAAVIEEQIIRAPPIHQEIITHHRHVDHGYEIANPIPRPISRPPSPPMPPPIPPAAVAARSEERIEIRRSKSRNGRRAEEDIIIEREESRREPELIDPYRNPGPLPPGIGDPVPYRRYDRDVREEAEYYNDRAMDRTYYGEGWRGSTRDWGTVDVPPGTSRVQLDGAGGASQEITWQRYNGARRSRFYPDGDDRYVDFGYGRPMQQDMQLARAGTGDIGRRYERERDPTAGLWTEVTKDLVVKEAIQEMGYEFEETDEFYYIIAYLQYNDVARLVGLSEDIRKDRRKRIKEIDWENRVRPESPRLAIEAGPFSPSRPGHHRSEWDNEDERVIEREMIYRGPRPPPPMGPWRR